MDPHGERDRRRTGTLTGLPAGTSQQRGLQARVVAVAEKVLAKQKFVTPLDLCLGIGWLPSRFVDDWKQGRKATLEQALPVHGNRLANLLDYLERWAAGNGLKPSEAEYIAQTRDRRTLRFTENADPQIEAACARTGYRLA